MRGIAINEGIALGFVVPIGEKKINICRETVSNTAEEVDVFCNALKSASQEIEKEKQLLLQNGEAKDSEMYEVLEAHEMMLLDEEVKKKIERMILENKITASWATEQIFEEYQKLFEQMEDDYLKARSVDCIDVKNRILQEIDLDSKQAESLQQQIGPCVLVAKELFPSDLLRLNQCNIVGILTEEGSQTSHVAILAKTRNIPAITGAQKVMEQVKANQYIILDGTTGEYFLNPSQQQRESYEERKKVQHKEREKLKKMIGKTSITKTGKKLLLLANIGSPDDIEDALKNDAEGVGLFRTEFLFMDRTDMPDEEEQYHAYRKVAKAFKGKEVIIRTLDAGGDKNIPYLEIPKEPNPFLGYRAIRLCLGRPDIFRVQLRALLRANVYENIKIMIPMICNLQELKEVKILAGQILEDLKKERMLNSNIELPPIGIMIETPAAVMISDELAKEADFFSIGTNDLIQYTLAADRTNQDVAYLYDMFHPAIKKMICATIKNGHSNGISVGLCGEAGSNEKMLEFLIECGIDEVSMSSGSILKARSVIRNSNL